MALYRYNSTNNKLIPLTSEGSVGIPVGAVLGFYGSNNGNDNWLLCDGRDTTGTDEELRTHYPALYTYLGNSNVLPDLRECVLVGAGQNDTDTIADHDVYTVGEFKDDQLQEHQHLPNGLTGGRIHSGRAQGVNNTEDGISARNTGNVVNARTGTTTHGKQKGVNYYIKATSAGPEVDYDVFATKGYVDDTVDDAVRDANSYITDEQLTGGKWIDGKPIYRKVITGIANFSNSFWTSITISNDNVSKTIINYRVICEAVVLRISHLTVTNVIELSTVTGYPAGNGYAINNNPYTLVIEYTKATD